MSKFIMSNDDWNTLQHYAQYAWDEHQAEIGGYMVVKYVNDQFVFSEPCILEQEITGGNTDITQDALAEYYMKQEIENVSEPYWLCWWHSHHTMNVFWSSTDHAAIEQSKCNGYAFALVINLKGEQILRVSDWKTGIHTDTEVQIQSVKNEIPDTIKKEVEKLCTKPKFEIKKYKTPTIHKGYNPYQHTYAQIGMFEDEQDAEKVQLEADLDNILQDYLMDDDYDSCRKKVGNLNRKLGRDKSELRVVNLKKDNLDLVINVALAEDYIYVKGTEHDTDGMVAQAIADSAFERSFK